MKFLWLVVFGITLAGCTSAYTPDADRKNVLGGGYYVVKIQPGLHFIQAKTNFAPIVNESGAHKMWRDSAANICGEGGFRELGGSPSSYEDRPRFMYLRYVITVWEGFAICADSGLTDQQAIDSIKPQCAYIAPSACAL